MSQAHLKKLLLGILHESQHELDFCAHTGSQALLINSSKFINNRNQLTQSIILESVIISYVPKNI